MCSHYVVSKIPKLHLQRSILNGRPLSESALMHLLPWRQRKGSLWRQNELSMRQSLSISLLTWSEGRDYVAGGEIVRQANLKDRAHNLNQINMTLGPICKHIGLITVLAPLNDFPKINS